MEARVQSAWVGGEVYSPNDSLALYRIRRRTIRCEYAADGVGNRPADCHAGLSDLGTEGMDGHYHQCRINRRGIAEGGQRATPGTLRDYAVGGTSKSEKSVGRGTDRKSVV